MGPIWLILRIFTGHWDFTKYQIEARDTEVFSGVEVAPFV
jgi:hypothetical protein